MIYLPQSIADELNTAKIKQTEYMEMPGNEYCDYDLVAAQINGLPYEKRSVDKMFSGMISKHSLRPVVFRSLRNSSTSLKLKLSRGNIKAVQGDGAFA